MRGGGGAVKAELVLAAAQRVHAGARLVGEVEGVAHDAPHRAARVQLLGQSPEIAVQNRVAAGDAEVRLPTHAVAEVIAAVQHVQHIVPGHRLAGHARVLAEQIAVLAALIALVGDMPLKRERGPQGSVTIFNRYGDVLVSCFAGVAHGGSSFISLIKSVGFVNWRQSAYSLSSRIANELIRRFARWPGRGRLHSMRRSAGSARLGYRTGRPPR